MIKGQVRVTIEDRLFSQIGDQVDAQVKMKALEVAGKIAARARATTEFTDKTGALRRRIDVADINEHTGVKYDGYVGVIVRARAPHAWLVENGHDLVRRGKKVGEVKAHPFLRPAADAELGTAPKKLADAVEIGISNAATGQKAENLVDWLKRLQREGQLA